MNNIRVFYLLNINFWIRGNSGRLKTNKRKVKEKNSSARRTYVHLHATQNRATFISADSSLRRWLDPEIVNGPTMWNKEQIDDEMNGVENHRIYKYMEKRLELERSYRKWQAFYTKRHSLERVFNTISCRAFLWVLRERQKINRKHMDRTQCFLASFRAL